MKKRFKEMKAMPLLMVALCLILSLTGCNAPISEEFDSAVPEEEVVSQSLTRSTYEEWLEEFHNWWNEQNPNGNNGYNDLIVDLPGGGILHVIIIETKSVTSGQIAEFELRYFEPSGLSLYDIVWDFGSQATIIGQGTRTVKVSFSTTRDGYHNWKVTFKDPSGLQRTKTGSILVYSNLVQFLWPTDEQGLSVEPSVYLGETLEIRASYREAIAYEWKILPDMNNVQIVSTTGNTIQIKFFDAGHYVSCRAQCEWGYTEWTPYYPLLREEAFPPGVK